MRDVNKFVLTAVAAAALAACSKPQNDNNVAIDNDAATPTDVEALPPDESSETSSNELINGADNADVEDAGNSANNSD
jgi:hypothetical protein